MTDVWLGVMAVALSVMAIIQVALIVVLIRLATQAVKTVQGLRNDVAPLIEKANRVAEDAARAASLAVIQVERLDSMLQTTAARVEDAVAFVQDMVGGPIRQGSAIFTALRAAFSVFQGWRSRPRQRPEDDDALFVG